MKRKLTTKEFIEKARKVHGDKYDYSKVEYVNSQTKVCIICPEHGEFWQIPHNHLKGHGCSLCSIEKNKKKLNSNTEEFIRKAKEIHGDKYDYSKVEYKNTNTKVCIICSKHGEFWQKPGSHLQGNGCNLCGNEKISEKLKDTKDDFVEKARKIHGNKYDYSKVDYKNNYTKVCIICPEHGEFWQRPQNHLIWGCKQCGTQTTTNKKTKTTEYFVNKARMIHGDKYDYSKVDYKNNHTKVCIICPEHGEFWQMPGNHFTWGCKQCGYDIISQKTNMGIESFIDKAQQIHGNKYDYSKVDYKNRGTKVCIICPKHGEFWQRPDDHLQGKGCSICGHIESKSESEIYDYVCNMIGGEYVEKRKRNIIPPYELDIYLPKYNIAIEYNGLLWHSETYCRNKNYHLNKMKLCKEKGINLIQIFEDEYILHKKIVNSKIKHILGASKNEKIYGRKCIINEIKKEEAKYFLEKNHIQGFVASTIYIGAFYNNELIAVMTFKKIEKNNNKWELTRFASNIDKCCIGVGGKLFSFFVKGYNPTEIKSFADRRWIIDENNNFYTKIGFYIDGYTNPDYKYFKKEDGIKRQHKFGFRKNILHRKYGLPLSMTENEMTKKLGYHRIWDCGLIRYKWTKNK